MKDVIIVSYLTERRHMIDEYEDQLIHAEIDYHFHPVTLKDGIASVTARWKLDFIVEMASTFYDYKRIVFTDAWDVLFFGTKEELIPKIPEIPIVSAERNCWPENDIENLFTLESPWRFVNAGMIAGNPQHLYRWAKEALLMRELDLIEQAWMNRRVAYKDYPICIDSFTSLFYTVSYDREDGSLRMKNGRLWNSRFDTFPQFFHFAGPCSSLRFRAMMRGRTEYL